MAARTHHRVTLTMLLLAASGLCWAWIVVMARDMYGPMTGASAWMMTPRWDAPHLFLLWAMWAVMMAAMMLPSALPVVLLAGRLTLLTRRWRNGRRGASSSVRRGGILSRRGVA